MNRLEREKLRERGKKTQRQNREKSKQPENYLVIVNHKYKFQMWW